MKNYDAEIARHILAAQLFSDAAKDDGITYGKSQRLYRHKDEHILSALHLIAKYHSDVFRFAVQPGKITWDCNLVYFTYYDGEETRLQVSFHNFSAEIRKFANPSQRTHWDEKSSRDSAYQIAKRYGVVKAVRREVLP